MKLFSIISLVFLFLTISPQAYSDENSSKTIAVVNFENTSNLAELNYLEKTISEYVNTYLLKTGRMKIVEREQLEKSSLRELNLNLTDIVDATTAAKLGKIEGAEAVVIGSFAKIGSTIVINSRLIDVETASGITAVQEKGKEDELVNLLDKVSESLKKAILTSEKPIEKPEELLCSLLISSNPPGASIYINGKPYGITPKDIYNLKEGRYEVVLFKEGHETFQKVLRLSLGDKIPVKANLFPQKGIIIAVSDPSEAEVYLDGEYQGVTKCTLENILAGTHQVTFKKKGYYEEERIAEVIYKETTTLEITLKEKPGSLLILSSPQGADVYLDGEYKGKTALSLSSVSPGEHKIRLTQPGRATHYETVTIRGEQNTTLDVALSPNNPPQILNLTATSKTVRTKETTGITCVATDPNQDSLAYTWFASGGSIQGEGERITYQAPHEPGTYLVKVEVSDHNGGEDTKEITITVFRTYFPGIKVDLPATTTPQEKIEEGIFISITRNNVVYLGMKRVKKSGLVELLKRRLGGRRGLVIINADKNTRHGQVVEVMDLAKQAGASILDIHASYVKVIM